MFVLKLLEVLIGAAVAVFALLFLFAALKPKPTPSDQEIAGARNDIAEAKKLRKYARMEWAASQIRKDASAPKEEDET